MTFYSSIRKRDVANLIVQFSTQRIENDQCVWVIPDWLMFLDRYTRERDSK